MHDKKHYTKQSKHRDIHICISREKERESDRKDEYIEMKRENNLNACEFIIY